jgi:hypothetical protein
MSRGLPICEARYQYHVLCSFLSSCANRFRSNTSLARPSDFPSKMNTAAPSSPVSQYINGYGLGESRRCARTPCNAGLVYGRLLPRVFAKNKKSTCKLALRYSNASYMNTSNGQSSASSPACPALECLRSLRIHGISSAPHAVDTGEFYPVKNKPRNNSPVAIQPVDQMSTD